MTLSLTLLTVRHKENKARAALRAVRDNQNIP